MANKKLTLAFEAIFVDRVSQGLAKLETDTIKVSKSVKSSLEAIQKGLLPIPTSNDQTAIVKLTEFKRLLDEAKKSLDSLNSIKLLGAGKVPKEIQQQFTPGSNGAFNAAKADKERRDQIKATQEFVVNLEKEFTALHAAQVKKRLADTLQEVAVNKEIQENLQKRIEKENALAEAQRRRKAIQSSVKDINEFLQNKEVETAKQIAETIRLNALAEIKKTKDAELAAIEKAKAAKLQAAAEAKALARQYNSDFKEGLVLNKEFNINKAKEILETNKKLAESYRLLIALQSESLKAPTKNPLASLSAKETYNKDFTEGLALHRKFLEQRQQQLEAALEKEILAKSKAALKAQQNEFYLGNIQKLATQYRPLSNLTSIETSIADQKKLNAIGSKILQEEEKALLHNRAIWKEYITERLNKEDLLRDKIIKRLELTSRAESLKALTERPLGKLAETEKTKQLERQLALEKSIQAFRAGIETSNKGIITNNYASNKARLANLETAKENEKFLEKYLANLDKEISDKFKAVREKFLKEQKEFEKIVQGGSATAPTIPPKTLLGLSPTDISKTQAGYTKLYADLLAAQDNFVAQSAVLARKQAANLALPLESLAKFNGRVNSTIVPPGSSLSSGLTNPVLPTPKINTEALANYQKQFARQEELAKNSAASLEGIALRRDIAIEQEEQRHAAKLLASEKALADAIAKNWSASAQKQITDQAALASSQSSQRIALLQQNAAKELAVQQGNVNKFNQNLQEQTERTRFNIAEQHALHVHGAESLQVAQVRANERQRQLAQDLQRSLADIARRQASGALPLSSANAEVLHAQQQYTREILNSSRALHTLEQHLATVADRHRNIFLRVGEIISAYTVWNAVRNTLFNALRSVPAVGMELETTKSVLATTMGGYSEATLVLKKLTDEADRTGIKLTALRETWRNFSASTSIAGESVETSWKIFKNMDTVITSLHLSADKATGIFNALAQIFNKSKVQSEELVKQLGNLLPGAFAAFAKANGYATQELVAKMKKGEVFAHDTIEKFAEFYAKRFEHSFDKASQSLNANVGRMQNAWILLGETIYGQTSGIMVNVVKTFTSLGTWLDNDIKGANLLGNSIKLLAIIGTSSFIVFLTKLPLVKAAFDSITASIAVNRAAIVSLAATSNTALATMRVGAALTGRVMTSAFALLTSPTAILIGIGLIVSKMAEARSEAKAFKDRLEESSKFAQDQRVKKAIEKTPQDTFKLTLANDPELKSYIENLKILKEKEKLIFAQRTAMGLSNTENLPKSLTKLKQDIIDNEENIATKTEQIRQTVDKDYIVSTKDHHAALQRLAIERLNNEGKTLEAAKLQYELTNKETLADFEDKVAEELRIREQANKKIAEFQKMGLATLSESNKGDYALAQQQVEASDKALIEYRKGIEDYKFNLANAGRVKETQAIEQSSNTNLKLIQSAYAKEEKLQKVHFETLLRNITAQQEQLRYVQDIKGQALPELDYIAKQEKLIEQERLLTLEKEKQATEAVYDARLRVVKLDSSGGTSSGSDIFAKIRRVESSDGKFLSNSTTSAQGSMQILNAAYEDIRKMYAGFPAKAKATQAQLQKAGELYFEQQLKTFQDTNIALAAYNQGPGAVQNIYKKTKVDVGSTDEADLARVTAELTPAMKGYIQAVTGVKQLAKTVTTENKLDVDETTFKEQAEQRLLDIESKKLSLTRDREKAIISFTQHTKELQIEEAQAQGNLEESTRLQLELQYKEELRLLNKVQLSAEYSTELKTQAKEQEKIVNFLVRQAELNSKLQVLQAQQANASEGFGLDKSLVDLKVSSNSLTSFRGDLAKSALAQQELDSANFEKQIKTIQARMRSESGTALGRSVNEIKQLKFHMAELQAEAEQVGNVIKGEVVDNLANSFIEFANGTKTATEALKSFGVNFLQMIEQIIVKEMALAAVEAGVNSIKGLFSAGGSVGGGSSSQPTPSNLGGGSTGFWGNKADGGLLATVRRDNIVQLNNFRKVLPGKISGPGSDTSDSITTVLPDGSYILKASAARRIGYDRLQKLISEGSKNSVNRPGKLVNVSANEVNIPPEVVQKYGVGFFDNLNRADGGAVGHINNIVPLNSAQGSTSVASQVNNITVHVTSSGKESPEELGTKISTAIVQAIAQKEAAKQVYLYDKSQKVAKGRKV